jgi:nucleotide-binding universal stress UspA family protein
MPTQQSVILGVDRGVQALPPAIEMAGWEAGHRKCRLHVVGTFDRLPDQLAGAGPVNAAAFEAASELVDEAVAIVHRLFPGLVCTSDVCVGSLAGALVRASKGAALVVVPADARLHHGGLLSGPVAAQVAACARAPIVAVPPQRFGRRSEPRVVIGIDGGAGDTDVLAYGFQAAFLRKATADVVYVWDPAALVGAASSLDRPQDMAAAHLEAERMVLDELERWTAKYPGVPVTHSVVAGPNPARVLSEASARAELVVVGARGHGGFTGLMLGSVADGLVRYSPTPVVVVPPASRVAATVADCV